MKIIGVIPARYGSTRFPGKPLAMISGKSLICRVYEQASRADLAKLLVATDDERIFSEVKSFGGTAVLTGEHTSGTDRIAEAVNKEDCDIVVNIQGDEPLIAPEVVNRVAASLAENSWASASTAAVKFMNRDDIDDPNIVKVVFSKDGRALYFSRSRIPYERNQPGDYYKHIGIYGYRRGFLEKFVKLKQSYLERTESLEQLRILEAGYSMHVSIVEYDSIGVDLPEDIPKVEAILKKMQV